MRSSLWVGQVDLCSISTSTCLNLPKPGTIGMGCGISMQDETCSFYQLIPEAESLNMAQDEPIAHRRLCIQLFLPTPSWPSSRVLSPGRAQLVHNCLLQSHRVPKSGAFRVGRIRCDRLTDRHQLALSYSLQPAVCGLRLCLVALDSL